MVLSGLLEVYKTEAIGHFPAAVMFKAGPSFAGLHRQLEAPREKEPAPVKLDTARSVTEDYADDWHNNAPPLGIYPALRNTSPWASITASFERVGSVGVSDALPRFRFVRYSPIQRRAGLRDYAKSTGVDMALVLDEMAAHPEPSEGDHIVQSLRFLHHLDIKATMAWLQHEIRDDERRTEVMADLALEKLDPEDIIVRAIAGIWPGNKGGKRRKHAYESIRLFTAEIITNLIARRSGSILLAGPLT